MVVQYIRYKLDPDQREHFIQAFALVIKQIDFLSACSGYDLLECRDDPSLFILRVEWTSSAHGHAFKPSTLVPGIVRSGTPFPDLVQENHYYKRTGVAKSTP